MENSNEPENPHLTVTDVINIMGCKRATAYSRIRVLKDTAKNFKSMIGSRPRLLTFLECYPNTGVTYEECLRIIKEPKLMKQK